MKITVLTNSEASQAHLSAAYHMLDDGQRRQLQLAVVDPGGSESVEPPPGLEAKLAAGAADFVLFDAHGVRKEIVEQIKRLLSKGEAQFVPVGGDAAEIRPLFRLGRLTADRLPGPGANAEEMLPNELREDYGRFVKITEYWRGGGSENMLGLLCLAGREYGGCDLLPVPSDPVSIQELCLLDPRRGARFSSQVEYRKSRGYTGHRPTVALLFLGNGNPQDIEECVGELTDAIEAFAEVLPVAFPSVMHVSMERLRELLVGEERPVDLIVNLLPFRLGIGPGGGGAAAGAAEWLDALGAPMLHPFFLSGTTEEEWRRSVRGVNPSQLMVQVVLPELDGAIETFPIAALRREGDDPALGVALNRLALIPERTDRLVGRIRRWLELKRKANREKKLALICYNYPPGEATVFGGTFLDTFESVSRLLTRLKEAGYDAPEMSAEELRSHFVEGGLVNSGQWAGEQAADGMIRYSDPAFAAKLAARSWGGEAEARWGTPPGEIMSEQDAFLIPGIAGGRIFIGLQPSRGIHEDPEKSLHDRSLLPTHQYTAFYQWLREEWGADAVVHIGTHGTLEFQRGKECGMSGDCVPDDFIGDLPHLYYYYVGNPSEAMIAKRRSHAVLVGYQAPPFTEAELYGEWAGLETLLHEYREAQQLDPDRCEDILTKLRAAAKTLHFAAESPEEIEEELYRMQRSLIPSGLHVLGEGYSPEAAAAHMRFVLRHERGTVRSLRGLLAERKGKQAEEIAAEGRTEELRKLDREAEELIADYLAAKELPSSCLKEPPAWRDAVQRTLEYGYRAYESSMANEEMEGLLKALEGRYLRAQLAGDALRSPEVLPSGRNLYQFDPRAVPSLTAAERGARTAENSIRQYYERHGEYPGTTAIVLWGLETSRTQGETIGQILHYMGVRAGGGIGTFRTEYDVIPLSELGRPRLNVVVHMTGLFRDLFPNLLEELNRLFRRVSELDEPGEMNRFKAHTRKTEADLLAAGYAPERARDLASARIFGPAEGQYGTGMTRLIETKQWSEEAELGQAYADGQQYVYSLGERGCPEPELYRAHLLAVDVVSQIRSSHEWEVTDSDHYYEYFGGLSKSVEMVKGSPAEIHITDTTGEQPLTESAEHAIARGVRTRLTNPKWIDALLKHPHHGAEQIARRFEYVLGLAATTGKVEPWVFDQLHEVYVADEERSRQMSENNRWAYHAMMETLLESHQRGIGSRTKNSWNGSGRNMSNWKAIWRAD
ncbi:cobaltochelatase subunit CobN [Paenibacillus macerans]|uniref:cobaltochelatase subunit CobN n=1 Tax=Paenibacillus macerans TaxID=44252 RepID=UPI00203FFCDE|nr:cobaltochelatase subunit CobN [Paenibacillus macerans]MCM3701631.1 cobaltochelatase subunit CobN [Paenibacillus macerans]